MRYFTKLAWLVCLLLLCCSPHPSSLKTDLEPSGNAAVLAAYENFVQSGAGCRDDGNATKRVLLTGFGLFSEADFNISGAVVHAMATGRLSNGATQGPLGVDVYQRAVTVGDEVYAVCYLVLDVKWDFAAAVIVHVMNGFQPHTVIMTGSGDERAILEGAALNDLTRLGGFNGNGSPDPVNVPINDYVLPPNDPGVMPEIRATWDNQMLRERLADRLAMRNIELLSPTAGRTDNNYICNNTSFVVMHAARNVVVRLAGETLKIRPTLAETPDVGFLHLPITEALTAETVAFWGNVLTDIFVFQTATR